MGRSNSMQSQWSQSADMIFEKQHCIALLIPSSDNQWWWYPLLYQSIQNSFDKVFHHSQSGDLISSANQWPSWDLQLRNKAHIRKDGEARQKRLVIKIRILLHIYRTEKSIKIKILNPFWNLTPKKKKKSIETRYINFLHVHEYS